MKYHGTVQRRSDHYTAKAKSEGFPARSVFKLKEIQRKFHVLKPGCRVLDVGAAPGSWSMYVLEVLGGRGRLTAVDLSPLVIGSATDNLTTITGDVFSPEVMARITEGAPYDVILSDAAPSTIGNRIVDTLRSEALVEHVVELARSLLAPGGHMVVKIFQGSGQKRILEDLRSMFESGKAFKPQASRSESFETYFIGLKKKKS
jgi:23S rRNA (uridine2552-2'-O)-methyltransferase